MEEDRKRKIKELEKELFILKHTHNCIVCGKEFFSGKSRKYCSSSCRSKHFIDNMTEEKKEEYLKRQRDWARKKRQREYYREIDKTPDIYYSTEIVDYSGFYGRY